MVKKALITVSLVCLLTWCKVYSLQQPAPSKKTLGKYIILTNLDKKDSYFKAVKLLKKYRRARVVKFDEDDFDGMLRKLRIIKPEYVAIVAKPETIDVNFAYRFLQMATKLDDDPFVDFAYGFITGKDSRDTIRFIRNIIKAEKNIKNFPKKTIEFGPANIERFQKDTEPWIKGFSTANLCHKGKMFPGKFLRYLEGNGIIRFWGDGSPERIVDSLTAR
jgi:hypothetical protein